MGPGPGRYPPAQALQDRHAGPCQRPTSPLVDEQRLSLEAPLHPRLPDAALLSIHKNQSASPFRQSLPSGGALFPKRTFALCRARIKPNRAEILLHSRSRRPFPRRTPSQSTRAYLSRAKPRVGEKWRLAAREALARSLAEDPEAAALALRGVWQAGASWEEAWIEGPWWRSDPAVARTTPGELRRKLNAGRLGQDDLLGFGSSLGRYLRASDGSWTGLIEADPELLRRLLENAYSREPGYAGAWARELAGNDPELLEIFAASPGLQGVVRREEVWLWIKQAAEDLAACDANAEPPRAGTQGEQFRYAFGKWAFSSGWLAILGRLRNETRRAAILRKLMAMRWKAQPETFLSFYGRILPLPVASGLAERGAEELSGTDVPVAILAALESWNIPVASVLTPVWSRFLSDRSILEDLCRSIAEAGPHSPLHSISVPAVREMEIRGCRLPTGALDPVEGMSIRRELLLASPRLGSDLWKSLVATISYGDGWQPLAGWILCSPERVLAFRAALREAMRADPGIPGALASASLLPGDPAIGRRLDRILEQLIEVTLSDRTLWEGLVTDHTGGIRTLVDQKTASE